MNPDDALKYKNFEEISAIVNRIKKRIEQKQETDIEALIDIVKLKINNLEKCKKLFEDLKLNYSISASSSNRSVKINQFVDRLKEFFAMKI